MFCLFEIGCFACLTSGVSLYSNTIVLYVADNSVSYIKHPSMSFLRRVYVTKAITALRNLGLYPFKTAASSMPDKFSIDNFAHFKKVFHVYYCYLEGLLFHRVFQIVCFACLKSGVSLY